jgi:topoisomerase-4 subunit A
MDDEKNITENAQNNQDNDNLNTEDEKGTSENVNEDDDKDALSEEQDVENADEPSEKENSEEHSDYIPANRFDASAVHHLSGMYKNWFLDYASYVILERAVPHIDDGLKPVQRRILHSMKEMDDGRYNKVANIVGNTMKYHPHGDASIGDALVQMGQKDLLIDAQGNWGNILTGDPAAAPRYIEARLSKFALDIVFNPKTTDWQLSYDGRNREPITLPVKFPLLLAQGAEGIAVGLSSKILPHNVNEICDAAISYLQGKPFNLYPDFPTGGSIDVSKYNDGERGGILKVRAKIEKVDSKTLAIREIPFSKTSQSLIDSILKAIDKGKIKARKVDDNTAANVEILIHLATGVSPDKTIDALYAFSDCEINISPNCCVIEDDKPHFMNVSDVLRHTTDRTMGLLRKELQIRRNELLEALFFASLERIFIEERIYKDKEFEQAPTLNAVVKHVDSRLEPFKKNFVREVTRDDILRLLEIKMQRILKFNKDKADKLIIATKKEIGDIDRKLNSMVDVTIEWFKFIKQKYGKNYPRRTEIKNFDTIEVTKVVEANEKLYVNRKEGFVGTSLKKDEFVCNCSDLDDIILFYRNGKFKIVKVADKIFVGKDLIHLQVFKRNDRRTIYNVVYRDGKNGPYYIKRFNVTGITREHEYDLTQGKPDSKVFYLTDNPNGEAEVIKVTIIPTSKRKSPYFERDFADIEIKGRKAHGRKLTKEVIHHISLKSHGHSTLGGRKVWYDADVNRINYEGRGRLLGEFKEEDNILVVLPDGNFYLTAADPNNHFEDEMLVIEKYDPDKIWTAVLNDAVNDNNLYLKRFRMEATKHRQSFLYDVTTCKLHYLTDEKYTRFKITFGESDSWRQPLEILGEEFVGVKGFKAHGKRIVSFNVKSVTKLESLKKDEEETVDDDEPDDNDVQPSEDEIETQNVETDKPEEAPEAPQKAKKHNEEKGELDLFPDES